MSIRSELPRQHLFPILIRYQRQAYVVYHPVPAQRAVCGYVSVQFTLYIVSLCLASFIGILVLRNVSKAVVR
jgi:hypothetical protein